MSETPLLSDDVKQAVKQHWDSRAATFDDAVHHGIHSTEQRDAWLAVLRRLTDGRPLRVLDVGCGTGFLTMLLAELGCAADGVDIAPDMLERARAKATASGITARFFEGDAESPPVPDGDYDLVVERHVIWTLPNPDSALGAWRRVLRPGGRVALIEGQWGGRDRVQPDYEPIHQALPLYGGMPSAALAERLTAAGFTDIAVEPLLDATLWGEEVTRERYLITAVRP
jgi:ubiquinone/menaquinone biosynthesis C-methylase UbiE